MPDILSVHTLTHQLFNGILQQFTVNSYVLASTALCWHKCSIPTFILCVHSTRVINGDISDAVAMSQEGDIYHNSSFLGFLFALLSGFTVSFSLGSLFFCFCCVLFISVSGFVVVWP